MQWNASKHAGFTSGTRGCDNYPEVNVEAAQRDPDSIYHFWQNVLNLRKEHSDVFIEGGYEMYDLEIPIPSHLPDSQWRAARLGRFELLI
ncbi:hypothetical protein GJ744_000354 [Endocarpon pusillum]|uniref:Glycosyl hydrolase family 13 catalytic domain-containing protein n=1 Tax=Endocarpon pusillum TaxID=364733 RepID=A0A8H7E862_9EURO|nr:hypothetical protein GJ744_000354 [Endocarpon pusillum]